MPIFTLKKLGKNGLNLISINMKMINFIGDMTTAIRVLVANITMGPQTLSSAFFIIDSKPSYSRLLGRD